MGYLTTAEVAELLHVKPDTVRKWRQEVGKGPRWTRWPGTTSGSGVPPMLWCSGTT